MSEVIRWKRVPVGYEAATLRQRAYVKWIRRPGIPPKYSKEELEVRLKAMREKYAVESRAADEKWGLLDDVG